MGKSNYSKIELYNNDNELSATIENCSMYIEGNSLVVVKNTNDSVLNKEVTEGLIFNTNLILRYKTYK